MLPAPKATPDRLVRVATQVSPDREALPDRKAPQGMLAIPALQVNEVTPARAGIPV